MKGITAKVGNHIVFFDCYDEVAINLITRNFHKHQSIYSKPDLYVTVNTDYGKPFLNYNVEVFNSLNKVIYQRTDYLLEVDSEYKYATIAVYDELALKHALMNLYSSFIVYHNWGLLIHSSCVVDNGRAHLFAGQSGAGKSTVAKLSSPRELLSDEATILKIRPNRVTVFDSPFRSEIDIKGSTDAFPLASMQILHQSFHNQRARLKKSDAYLQIIDKVFFWSQSQEETKRIMDLLRTLVNNVPVYELYFQKNNKFWELISS